MRKSTVSTEVVNAKTVILATSHDIAQPTMMNVLHVRTMVKGQDAAEKKRSQKTVMPHPTSDSKVKA